MSTIFQRLNKALGGGMSDATSAQYTRNIHNYSGLGANDVLYTTSDKGDYDRKLAQMRQQRMLARQWKRAQYNISNNALANQTEVQMMYREADMMDLFPEVGAALDLYMEEACLCGDTKIKLLDGTTQTIKELFDKNIENFWVYAVDENGECKPSLVERVINKGSKNICTVVLDDGTRLRCTEDHKWMLSDGSWVEAKDLKFGDSMMSIYSKLNYLGYEQIKSTVEPKFRLTHRLVAENVLHADKVRLSENNEPYQKIVIHHKSFNKLNNNPDQLQYMYWNDHQKLHTDLNSERWKNEEFATRMRTIMSETAKAGWADKEKSESVRKKMSESHKRHYALMTDEERKNRGLKGSRNGMFGVHRYGSENPNYNPGLVRFEDIDENEYIKQTILNENNSIAHNMKIFGLTREECIRANGILTKKYGCNRIASLKYYIDGFCTLNDIIRACENGCNTMDDIAGYLGFGTSCIRRSLKINNISFNDIKNFRKKPEVDLDEYVKCLYSGYSVGDICKKFNIHKRTVLDINKKLCKKYNIGDVRDLRYCYNGGLISEAKKIVQANRSIMKTELAEMLGIKECSVLRMCKVNGYNTYNDFKNSCFNHRVVEVIRNNETETVYDLYNSSVNNCFGVACNSGLVISHNCYVKPNGMMINVTSKSERIKNILEDLIYNRLSANITFPMITRSTVKYGNTFMLLNITEENGITGWKQLPVYEMQRFENGMENPYSGAFATTASVDVDKPDSTKFVWVGMNEYTPYRNWQIAHFRLLYDSLYLPYGVSAINKARRHWRMLSMMEDMMLMYRLERSVERRVFKVNVGAIDEQDVPAYMDEIANNFKRTPVVDPLTGQLDLRRNIMPVWKNTPIPLLDGRVITIEELAREYENGRQNYVYSVQDGTHKIVPGKVVWCGKNYTAKKMVKVTLDDGGFVVLAPEHEFIMRDGSRRRADEVRVGESVMPFYTEISGGDEDTMKGYEMVYNPHSGKYEYTHRLVADGIEKPTCEDKRINTVHHVDFNKRNNNPENLLWCNFNDHRKMHSELSTRNNLKRWGNPVTRRSAMEKLMEYNNSELHKEHNVIRSKAMTDFWKSGNADDAKRRMTVVFDDYVWDKLGHAVYDGLVYNRESALDYINTELIEHILDINTNKRLHNIGCISRTVLQERVKELGFASISEYLDHVHDELGGVNPKGIVKTRKSDNMAKFNGNGRKCYVEFSDYVWDMIRKGVVRRELNCVSDITRFVNENLIGEIAKYNGIAENGFTVTADTVTRRIYGLGFANTTDYIEAMRKNHKIVKIEYVNGDDVYCMTVEGLNSEDDRHNFAVRSIYNQQEQSNQDFNVSGCFVANCQLDDFFIPVRDPSEPNPIETLSAGQNMTAMDDIKFVQHKLCIALRTPLQFLNFEQAQGDGKNLAMLDVRFTRTINRVQQMMLMELNKVCIIHLMLLGFEDDLTNFQLSMNNPSSQAEMMELDNLSKKIEMAKSAVADPGGGIPIMSVTRACKEILGWTDKQISDNLEELRLEKALAVELQQTQAIIKRTGLFDRVDNLYGEVGATYQNVAGGQGQEGAMGGAPGGGMLGGMPGGMDGMDDMGDMAGEDGTMEMGDAAEMEGAPGEEGGAPDLGGPEEAPAGGGDEGGPLMEDAFMDRMFRKTVDNIASKGAHAALLEHMAAKGYDIDSSPNIPIYQKNFFVNEELDAIAKSLDKKLSKYSDLQD